MCYERQHFINVILVSYVLSYCDLFICKENIKSFDAKDFMKKILISIFWSYK